MAAHTGLGSVEMSEERKPISECTDDEVDVRSGTIVGDPFHMPTCDGDDYNELEEALFTRHADLSLMVSRAGDMYEAVIITSQLNHSATGFIASGRSKLRLSAKARVCVAALEALAEREEMPHG